MIPDAPEFSRLVRIDQIPAKGVEMDIKAKPAERTALADRFDLQSVDRLEATIRLKAMAGGALIRLDATIRADVVQTCVVSLEPVPASVEQEFSLTFGAPEPEEVGAELELSLDDEDPPDPIVDGAIDVGEAVAEHLALALDPFPRKPGVDFSGAGDGPSEPDRRPNPFAVLAEMRKNKE